MMSSKTLISVVLARITRATVSYFALIVLFAALHFRQLIRKSVLRSQKTLPYVCQTASANNIHSMGYKSRNEFFH